MRQANQRDEVVEAVAANELTCCEGFSSSCAPDPKQNCCQKQLKLSVPLNWFSLSRAGGNNFAPIEDVCLIDGNFIGIQ